MRGSELLHFAYLSSKVTHSDRQWSFSFLFAEESANKNSHKLEHELAIPVANIYTHRPLRLINSSCLVVSPNDIVRVLCLRDVSCLKVVLLRISRVSLK